MYQVHYILCMYTLHCTRYTISIANYPLLHIYTSQCTTGTLYQVHSVLYPLQDGQAGVITKEPLTAAAAVISGSQSSIVHCVIIGTRVRAMDCLVPGPLHWSELSVFAIISTPLPSFRKINYKYYIVLAKVPAFKINTDPDLVNCMCQIAPPQLCLMFKAHIRLHNVSSNRYDTNISYYFKHNLDALAGWID